jgi:hypothetical protein
MYLRYDALSRICTDARRRWLGNPEVVQVASCTHISATWKHWVRMPTVLDPLPAAVECSNLQALHFVERLHWPRLQSVGTRRSRRKPRLYISAQITFMWDCNEVCMARILHSPFLAPQASALGGCVACMNLQLASINVPGCVHEIRLATATAKVGWALVQTCEDVYSSWRFGSAQIW